MAVTLCQLVLALGPGPYWSLFYDPCLSDSSEHRIYWIFGQVIIRLASIHPEIFYDQPNPRFENKPAVG